MQMLKMIGAESRGCRECCFTWFLHSSGCLRGSMWQHLNVFNPHVATQRLWDHAWPTAAPRHVGGTKAVARVKERPCHTHSISEIIRAGAFHFRTDDIVLLMFERLINLR